MKEELPVNLNDNITDEMLVRMVVLLLKDISKLGPFLDRLCVISAKEGSPLFMNSTDDPRLAEIAQNHRRSQVRLFTDLLHGLVIDSTVGVSEFVNRVADVQKDAVLDKAMKDLGLEITGDETV